MTRTTLLLLPGLLCDAALWRHQIAALGNSVTPVVADLTQDDSIEAMAERALATVDGPFAMAGMSMGGYVALAVLQAVPERVSRLMLLDTSARADSPEQARRRRGLMTLIRRAETRFHGVTPHLLPELVHPSRVADPVLGATIIDMADRVGRDAYLRQQQAILSRPDRREALPGLRLPTRVVVGEADRLTPPALAREIAGLIPGAALSVLPGCGHLPPLEDPEAVTALMRTWLDDGDAP